MRDFMSKTLIGALLFAGAVKVGTSVISNANRNPSSIEDTYELSIQSLSLDASSRLSNLDGVFIRATFAQTHVTEFGRTESWKVNRGESKALNIKLDLQKSWIGSDDSMEFKIEIVQNGLFDTVLVRCGQVAKEVSQYNRSYQCTLPNETMPILSYRVAKKTTPGVPVAQN